MEYNRAKDIKTSILFDFLFANKRILKSSALHKNELLKADIQEFVNGIAIVKDRNEGYKLKFYSEGTLFSSKLAEYLNIPEAELIIDNIGEIRIQAGIPTSGYCLGHYDVSGGTLGCYVRDQVGTIYLLSNNHVVANTNKGKVGDPILHPCQRNGGKVPDNVVGTLAKFVPLSFNNELNYMDCGIGKSMNQDIDRNEIPIMGKIKGLNEAELDMEVIKFGQLSNLTTGKVISVDTAIKVNYGGGFLRRNIAVFDEQIEIKSTIPGTLFSRVGDSGSLIVDNQSVSAVGLLFAAGMEGTTFANPIKSVLKALYVDFI